MRRVAAASAVAVAALVLSGCSAQSTLPGSGSPTSVCGSSSPLPAETTQESISVAGSQRRYLLSLPASDATPAPLLFDFPGLGESNLEEIAYSQLGPEAAGRGWIAVTPEAAGAVPRWTIPPIPGPDDVQFVSALITRLESEYCVDPHRVFAAGISNGAAFVGSLGCRLSDKLAGAAMVAGINASAQCPSQPPLPVIGFNGTADPIVPFNGGKIFGGADQQGGGIVPAATDALAGWAVRNRCSGSPATTDVAPDVQLMLYGGCQADTQLYVLVGGGHTWPGAAPVAAKALGPTNESVGATQLILDFFAKQGR